MKHLYKSAVFAFIVANSFCSYSQQMVQTPKDIPILCQKDNKFVGKPLKVLLKEIKPPIKMVYAEGGWAEQAPQFAFYFMSKKGFDNYRRQGKLPLRMRVYIKDFFQWTFEDRMKTRDYYTDWTKEDEERYGNLIITAIRVAGEYELCDDVPIAETLVPLAVTSQHNIITGFSYLFF